MKWIKKYWYVVAVIFPITVTTIILLYKYLVMPHIAAQKANDYVPSTPDGAVDQAQANLSAFLLLIRNGESSLNDSAYTELVGGGHFDNGFADHPRIMNHAVNSDAAGAYQFISTTWDRVAKACGFTDFSPENQDKGAVFLITERGAYDAVVSGDIQTAVDKCSPEWDSLPCTKNNGMSYYHHTVRIPLTALTDFFTNNGGQTA